MVGRNAVDNRRARDGRSGTTASVPGVSVRGTLVSQATPITQTQRIKFGLVWVLMSVFTLGTAVLLWLVMPDANE